MPRWLVLRRSRRPARVVGLATAVVLVALSTGARADPILGHLALTGNASFSTAAFDFSPAGGGTGRFAIGAGGQTGSFAPLSSTQGTFLDLGVGSVPVGVDVALPGFALFDADAQIRFDLVRLETGAFSSVACQATPAAGQTCTPAAQPSSLISALSLTNTTATSSHIEWSVRGWAVDPGDGRITRFSGILGADMGFNFQTVLSVLGSGGSLTFSYAGAFDVVPALLFADGFESGTTGAWSFVAP